MSTTPIIEQAYGELISPQTIDAVVERIAKNFAPQRIILFGSYASGQPTPDSDLDLLIVQQSDLPRYKRSAPYRRALCGLFPAKDIVVWTPAEIDEWRAVPHAFITTILATGRILYEG